MLSSDCKNKKQEGRDHAGYLHTTPSTKMRSQAAA
jgi:hypothetical protein